MKGQNRWEPVLLDGAIPVPSVPAPVPTICEAVPTGSRTGSQFAPPGSLPPPYGGNGGPNRERATIRRRASLQPHHCGEHTLTGLDANRCALTVRVDPYPLTAIGEVEALRAGRRTYLLDHGELHPRTAWNIPGHPAGAQHTVLAEHDCTELPDDWRRPPTERRSTTPTSKEAQF